MFSIDIGGPATPQITSTLVPVDGSNADNGEYGVNLLVSPDAESIQCATNADDIAPPPGDKWTVQGKINQVFYSANLDQTLQTTGPQDRGYCYYFGGNGEQMSGQVDSGICNMSQFINLTAYSMHIDGQSLSFNLSAYLGGVDAQEDNALVSVDFMDNDYNIIDNQQIGPVSASDRNFQTSLIYRETVGKIKALTRYINVYLILTRTSDVTIYGTNNDGNADALSFIINPPGESTRASSYWRCSAG
ncbi:unnamed protein product [Didymodactylos carnosus]|uniref:Uncharacterized protein n=1 Tax=Didymodactylos carnosus TaxID=1234261 RepID=A0A8S2DFY8_9BILA|nr:unnamed protein product [Didymodactylos carnosus]CAF3669115.1 unnamed protein product [Didymodactylos carnosus]